MNLGPAELMIILVIVTVLFGGKKIPEIARSLGEAQREFRRGIDEGAAPTEGDARPPQPSPNPTGSTDVTAVGSEPFEVDATDG